MLSLERAKLSLLLKNNKKENVSFSSFEGFLSLGKTNHIWFLKKKCIKIPFTEYENLNKHLVFMLHFIVSKQKRKLANTQIEIFENFSWTKKIEENNNETIRTIWLKIFDYDIILSESDLLSFIKAFRLLIIPSLNLTLNQANFLQSVTLKTKAQIEEMKNNNEMLVLFIVELKRKAYLPINEFFHEIFQYYYDYLLLIESLKKLEEMIETN